MANHNHQNFDARLNFASAVLREHFGFDVPANTEKVGWVLTTLCIPLEVLPRLLTSDWKKDHPLQYEEGCPFKYNNFVYLITLASATTASVMQTSPRLSTLPIPGSL